MKYLCPRDIKRGEMEEIMKKINKRFLSFGLSLAILASMATGIYATSVSMNLDIPRNQAMAYLSTAKKSSTSNYGMARINSKTADAVTFSVRALIGDFGPTATTYATGNLKVPYAANYPAGQSMQARFRNHNWTNAVRKITGTFDYL